VTTVTALPTNKAYGGFRLPGKARHPAMDARALAAVCPQMRGEVSRGAALDLAGARAPEMSTTIATLITTASR